MQKQCRRTTVCRCRQQIQYHHDELYNIEYKPFFTTDISPVSETLRLGKLKRPIPPSRPNVRLGTLSFCISKHRFSGEPSKRVI